MERQGQTASMRGPGQKNPAQGQSHHGLPDESKPLLRGPHPHDVKRVHVLVSGTVQGVWFRESTRRQAEGLGVVGWVRNLPDGRVEAVFEGPPPGVDALVAWCHEGPPNARVEQVEAKAAEPTGEFSSFAVLRAGRT
jgi:acylphosphatase